MFKKMLLSILVFILFNINIAQETYYYGEIYEIKGINKIENVEDPRSERMIKANIFYLEHPVNIDIRSGEYDFDYKKKIKKLTLVNKKVPTGCLIVKGSFEYAESGQTSTDVFFIVTSYKTCKQRIK